MGSSARSRQRGQAGAGRHHLTKDGVAGALTQNAIATAEAKTAEVTHSIPVGLFKGVAEGESGSVHRGQRPELERGADAGITQDNLIGELGVIARWRNAFDLRVSFTDLAAKLRKQYDLYHGSPGAVTARDAWFCAIPLHNWPAAPRRPRTASSTRALLRGRLRRHGPLLRRRDEPAYWVIQASGGRLRTACEWRDSYVSSKVMYVKSWGRRAAVPAHRQPPRAPTGCVVRGLLRKQYRLAESHLIAVGTEGYDTPAGVYIGHRQEGAPELHRAGRRLGGSWADARDVFPPGDVNNPIPGARSSSSRRTRPATSASTARRTRRRWARTRATAASASTRTCR